MLSKMAARAAVAYVETLTGFKWIARAALGRPGARLVFGYEEALGYEVGRRRGGQGRPFGRARRCRDRGRRQRRGEFGL